MDDQWRLFTGSRSEPVTPTFPPPPNWRTFATPAAVRTEWQPVLANPQSYWARARNYRVAPQAVDPVNAALLLRRPLLVTGSPGTGKTSLIYRVAWELSLGPVFVWSVNSRSKVQDGLYEYNALARLQDHQLNRAEARDDPGRYITLRSLGSAMLPSRRPRALLIDEIDKADPDLANDLLALFEDGCFEVPELQREQARLARVRPAVLPDTDGDATVEISDYAVRCAEFPFIVLTSNGERDFSPAFLRRCIRVQMPDPDLEQLESIVRAQLGDEFAAVFDEQIRGFASESGGIHATDQLLNALFLVHGAHALDKTARDRLLRTVIQSIQGSEP